MKILRRSNSVKAFIIILILSFILFPTYHCRKTTGIGYGSVPPSIDCYSSSPLESVMYNFSFNRSIGLMVPILFAQAGVFKVPPFIVITLLIMVAKRILVKKFALKWSMKYWIGLSLLVGLVVYITYYFWFSYNPIIDDFTPLIPMPN